MLRARSGKKEQGGRRGARSEGARRRSREQGAEGARSKKRIREKIRL
jgi:hypothetical protein